MQVNDGAVVEEPLLPDASDAPEAPVEEAAETAAEDQAEATAGDADPGISAEQAEQAARKAEENHFRRQIQRLNGKHGSELQKLRKEIADLRAGNIPEDAPADPRVDALLDQRGQERQEAAKGAVESASISWQQANLNGHDPNFQKGFMDFARQFAEKPENLELLREPVLEGDVTGAKSATEMVMYKALSAYLQKASQDASQRQSRQRQDLRARKQLATPVAGPNEPDALAGIDLEDESQVAALSMEQIEALYKKQGRKGF